MALARGLVAVVIALLLNAVAVAETNATTNRVCSTVNTTHPSVYLLLTSSGLSRLELSPSVPAGIARVVVSRQEIAALCTEGLDVRYLDTGLLPASFSIVRRGGAVYGNLWTAATTPDGATTQWLTFDLQSEAYAGQGEHAPVALFLDAPALTATPPAIIGNGIVFGEVNLAQNGCGGPSSPGAPVFNTEVEAFWFGGNHLWSETCGSKALADGPVYSVALQASTDGTFHFENRSGETSITTSPAINTVIERPSFKPGNGGVLVASTNFCNTCRDFSLFFSNVVTGWSANAVSDSLPLPWSPFTASADAIAFPARTIDTRSPPRQVTFTNNSSSAWDVQFGVKAANGPRCGGIGTATLCSQDIDRAQRSFVLTDSGCHPVFARGTCTVSIVFEPQGPFKLAASLEYRLPNSYIADVDLEGIGVPAQTISGTVLAVEYFNPELGHYFVTTLPVETNLLDDGTIAGWIRTGQWFWVYPGNDGRPSGRSPVCRFYGRPQAGLDSHFYAASSAECVAVLERSPDAWIIETSDLFDVELPDPSSGECSTGTAPVYRLYNNRPDANHRYTTDARVRSNMIAAGWIPEGYGRIGVVMCSTASDPQT